MEALCEDPSTDELDESKDKDSGCKGKDEGDGRVTLKGSTLQESTIVLALKSLCVLHGSTVRGIGKWGFFPHGSGPDAT